MKVYVGWDSKEDIAYQVCKYSIEKRTESINIYPLKQYEMRNLGIYTRGVDPKASTEFTFSRFFVPFLNDYKGWSVFCDCDFLWLEDIQKLFAQADDKYAVMVAKHDYTPDELIKMDNKIQLQYPRKNWSSMILWNNSHSSNKKLNLDLLNSVDASYLHQFKWLEDNEIGEVSYKWNWLEGWYKEKDGYPYVVHYTRGGPWFDNWQDVDFAQLWIDEKNRYLKEIG